MSNQKRIGTSDFYYQVAEDLDRLGVEFCIMVKERDVPSTICINNVDNPNTANAMLKNFKATFDRQFDRADDDED